MGQSSLRPDGKPANGFAINAPLLSALTPWQRSALGFPREDSEYWSPATLEAVGRSYPEVDMAPYERGRRSRL